MAFTTPAASNVTKALSRVAGVIYYLFGEAGGTAELFDSLGLLHCSKSMQLVVASVLCIHGEVALAGPHRYRYAC